MARQTDRQGNLTEAEKWERGGGRQTSTAQD